MLENVNPLPGTQRQIPIIDRNGQAGIRQHGADVGSSIVIAFQCMRVPAISFRDEAFHKRFQVGAGGRIPVFAHHQRGAGVRQEQKAQAFAHVPIQQMRADSFGDIVQSFTLGRDFEGGFMPVHGEKLYNTCVLLTMEIPQEPKKNLVIVNGAASDRIHALLLWMEMKTNSL